MVVPLILAAGLIFALFVDSERSTKSALEHAESLLMASATEQVKIVSATFDGQFDVLESYAASLSVFDELVPQDIFGQMDAITEKSMFNNVFFTTTLGDAYYTDGTISSSYGQKYFATSIRGETCIERVNTPDTGSPFKLVFSVPIVSRSTSRIIGVVCGEFDPVLLRQLITPTIYNQKCYSYIMDASGDLVVGSNNPRFLGKSDNLFELLESASEDGKSDVEFLREDLRRGAQEIFTYTIDGVERYIVFCPVNVNNLYIAMSVPGEVVESEVRAELLGSLGVMLLILAFVVLTILYILWRERVTRRILEQEAQALRKSEEFARVKSLEYSIAVNRMGNEVATYLIDEDSCSVSEAHAKRFGLPLTLHPMPDAVFERGKVAADSKAAYAQLFESMKRGEPEGSVVVKTYAADGGEVWLGIDFEMIFDESGKPLRAVLVYEDVTELREKELAYEVWRQQLSELPEERTAIFEYNLAADRCDKASGKLFDFASDYEGANFSERARRFVRDRVYFEDVKRIGRLFDRERLIADFHSGSASTTADFRYIVDGEQTRWLNVSAQLVEYPGTDEIKAYIIFRDIDDEMQSRLALKARSEQDALTGILNRGAFVERVRELLAQSTREDSHALLIVDVDHFKALNDTCGHTVGDEVLRRIAAGLRTKLRSSDIVGRIGGDEFMVCLPGITYEPAIEQRAKQICEMVRGCFAGDIPITGSVGIAVFPRDGTSFETLYENADSALYSAKEGGRNRYIFCDTRERESEKLSAEHRRLMLVVDEDEQLRASLTDAYSANFRVIGAKDDEQAFALLSRYGAGISVALLCADDGDFAQRILKYIASSRELAEIPVIAMVSENGASNERRVLAEGALECIRKPVDTALLNNKLKRALKRARKSDEQ